MAEEDGRLLLVVPCLNEAAHLPVLVPSLLADIDTGDLLVVADGGSTDGSREIVEALARRDARLHLLPNPARRQGAGVNLAVRLFGEDMRWLLRVDAHCGYPDGYRSALLDAARRHGADCVVVPMVTVGTGCFQRGVARAQNSRLGTGGSAHRHVGQGRWVDHGHHALMDLRAFRRAGGYDEAFSHNEDAELDVRLRRDGARLWLEPGAAITYYPRQRVGPLWRQYVGYGGGRARNRRRHGEHMRLRQALPLLVAPAMGMAVIGMAAASVSLWTLVLALPALAWMTGCLLGGAILGIRSNDRCAAMAGMAAMVMHFGWSTGYWLTHLQNLQVDDPPEPF